MPLATSELGKSAMLSVFALVKMRTGERFQLEARHRETSSQPQVSDEEVMAKIRGGAGNSGKIM